MSFITLRSDMLLATIQTTGAELQSVRDAEGIERIWAGDPDSFPDHSPVLFPIAGGLRDDWYTLRGTRYPLQKHGFAIGAPFVLEVQTDRSATFLLTNAMRSVPGFPFPYAFRVRYTLETNALHVAYIVGNTGTDPFYFGTGSHEAYACPEGIDAYSLVFDKPEALRHNVLAGSLLTGDTQPIQTEDDGRTLRLHTGLFANDTLVLSNLASRSVELRSTMHPRSIRVDFADYDYLLIWTRPPWRFICIEPWSNLPDRVDSDHEISHKPGMTVLTPGMQKIQTHTVTFA